MVKMVNLMYHNLKLVRKTSGTYKIPFAAVFPVQFILSTVVCLSIIYFLVKGRL